MKIVLKTNSAYSYLWPILNDTTEEFPSFFVLTNSTNDFQFNKNIKIHLYDQSRSYPARLLNFLESIEDEYVLLTHDVDLIINFNHTKIENYLNIVKCNNIDRLSLGVFVGNDKIFKNEIEVCKLYPRMSSNFFTPFDYAPSIYKKSKLIELYSKFSNENYQSLELNPEVQKYVFENMNSYGISKNNSVKLIYHRGFVYTEDFNFLHITVKGELLEENLYFDLKNIANNFIKKYNLSFLKTQKNFYLEKNEI